MKHKRTIVLIVIIVLIILGCGGIIFYYNQQTVPSSFMKTSCETFTPSDADDKNVNRIGIHLYLTFSKNKAQLNGADPATGPYKKNMNANSKTAKSIYRAFGHKSYKASDYGTAQVTDLGRTHIEQGKRRWILKSRKLTLAFSEDADGNWTTPDGTIWFIKKK